MMAYRWPNLVTMLFEQAARQGDAPFLWAKRDGHFRATPWREVARQVAALSAGLRSLGIAPGERIMLVAENRPEWLIADFAIMAAGAITVPAYTTNTPADHAHLLGDSGAAAAIVSTPRLLARVLPAAREAGEMRFSIAIDGAAAADGAVPIHAWHDVLARGESAAGEVVVAAAALPAEATACIIYTSGTGGAPKGVMLGHKALMHNCAGAEDALRGLGLEDETYLSFLPLSHAYEHTAGQFFPVWTAAQIYYSEGAEALARNFVEARPTIITAVPRLYETLHQRIVRSLHKSGGLRKALFDRTLAFGSKRYRNPHGLSVVERLQDAVLDRLVRDKVRAQFGGRLKAMVSGGAPLNPEVGLFFQALGLQILQGYGQTESAPVISVNRPGSAKLHTVGPLLENTEVRIAADGEILVRGDLVMQGYWRNEAATREALRDGWLHTGDVGMFDADAHLVITDRKKDIIVLSGGDNVSPARVEGMLTLEPEIAQAMVAGDRRPHLVAILVPDGEWLRTWAAAHGKPADLDVLTGDRDLEQALKAAIDRVNGKLSPIEKVRRIAVASEPFTIDNEQLTPTLKIRRHVIGGRYAELLERLYAP